MCLYTVLYKLIKKNVFLKLYPGHNPPCFIALNTPLDDIRKTRVRGFLFGTTDRQNPSRHTPIAYIGVYRHKRRWAMCGFHTLQYYYIDLTEFDDGHAILAYLSPKQQVASPTEKIVRCVKKKKWYVSVVRP